MKTSREQFEEWFWKFVRTEGNDSLSLHDAMHETWQASRQCIEVNCEPQQNKQNPVAWRVGGFVTSDLKWATRRSEEDNLLMEPLYRHPIITGIDENHYDPELEPGLYVAEIMTKGGAAIINGKFK